MIDGTTAPRPVFFDDTANRFRFEEDYDQLHLDQLLIWGRFFSDKNEMLCLRPVASSFDELNEPADASHIEVLDCATGSLLDTYDVMTKRDYRKVQKAGQQGGVLEMHRHVIRTTGWLHDMGAMEWPLVDEATRNQIDGEVQRQEIAGLPLGFFMSARTSPSGKYQLLHIAEPGVTDFDDTHHYAVVLTDRAEQARAAKARAEREVRISRSKARCQQKWKKCQADIDRTIYSHQDMAMEQWCDSERETCLKAIQD